MPRLKAPRWGHMAEPAGRKDGRTAGRQRRPAPRPAGSGLRAPGRSLSAPLRCGCCLAVPQPSIVPSPAPGPAFLFLGEVEAPGATRWRSARARGGAGQQFPSRECVRGGPCGGDDVHGEMGQTEPAMPTAGGGTLPTKGIGSGVPGEASSFPLSETRGRAACRRGLGVTGQVERREGPRHQGHVGLVGPGASSGVTSSLRSAWRGLWRGRGADWGGGLGGEKPSLCPEGQRGADAQSGADAGDPPPPPASLCPWPRVPLPPP